mgnify:CR=1 FL=1
MNLCATWNAATDVEFSHIQVIYRLAIDDFLEESIGVAVWAFFLHVPKVLKATDSRDVGGLWHSFGYEKAL